MRYLFMLLLFQGFYLNGQTCCSGGVPISGNLGLPSIGEKNLQFNIAYDLNWLNTLKAGSDRLDDSNRNRLTHSGLIEAGYAFNRKWSIDLLFSYIRQERKITRPNGAIDFSFSQGIGDLVVLPRYQLLNRHDGAQIWSLGIGAKLPTGSFNELDDRGILLNADLQPGSGSIDWIIWTQWSDIIKSASALSWNATLNFAQKGINNNFRGTEAYKFGNELQALLGLNGRFFINSLILDPSITLRYRWAGEDLLNDEFIPSTGGQWVFFRPAIAFWPTPKLSFNLQAELPLIANITGTQLSPTLRMNAGIYYRMDFRKIYDLELPSN